MGPHKEEIGRETKKGSLNPKMTKEESIILAVLAAVNKRPQIGPNNHEETTKVQAIMFGDSDKKAPILINVEALREIQKGSSFKLMENISNCLKKPMLLQLGKRSLLSRMLKIKTLWNT